MSRAGPAMPVWDMKLAMRRFNVLMAPPTAGAAEAAGAEEELGAVAPPGLAWTGGADAPVPPPVPAPVPAPVVALLPPQAASAKMTASSPTDALKLVRGMAWCGASGSTIRLMQQARLDHAPCRSQFDRKIIAAAGSTPIAGVAWISSLGP